MPIEHRHEWIDDGTVADAMLDWTGLLNATQN